MHSVALLTRLLSLGNVQYNMMQDLELPVPNSVVNCCDKGTATTVLYTFLLMDY